MIVRNDNHNTFDHVAKTLAGVLPGVSLEQGHRIAEQIHNGGHGTKMTKKPSYSSSRVSWTRSLPSRS